MYGTSDKNPIYSQHGDIAIAACMVDLNGHVPAEIQLTPAGYFRARDGRPKNVPSGWYIDAAIAERVIAYSLNTDGDFVIDYEHQTLNSEKNGQPAPAGGWWKSANMEWREGQGLFATGIDWMEAAQLSITKKEYRYISPVIAYNKKTGHVVAILMAALTNYPAIAGLSDLTEMAAAKFSFTNEPEEDNTVKREQLIALLGLATDASDTEIATAVKAGQANAASVTALRGQLGLDDDGDIAVAVTALKTAAEENEPDPSKYVSIESYESLKTDVAKLAKGVNENEVDDLVVAALSCGKLHNDQEAWARKLGEADIAQLKAYIETTPAIAALKGNQTNNEAPDGLDAKGDLTDEAIAVCKSMGIDQEDYKKSLEELAA